MNNFTMSHMSHMSQFSLPLYIDTCLFFTPAHAKEREKASISKSMQNSVISVISVMIIFCRQSLKLQEVTNDLRIILIGYIHRFYNSDSGVYRMTQKRHTPTPPGIESYDNIRASARAKSRPPSWSPRKFFDYSKLHNKEVLNEKK